LLLPQIERSAFSVQQSASPGSEDESSEGRISLLLAKDLKLLQAEEHEGLSQRATELKRMLTALLQKLKAH
jgi:four helix bundle protein